MHWAFFALIGTFVWSLVNIADKILKDRYFKGSLPLTAAMGISPLVISLLLLPIFGFPSFPISLFISVVVAGLLNTIGVYFYVRAMDVEEASRVVPLLNLSPLYTLVLAALFLGESLSPASYAAFALILAGGLLLSGHKIGHSFKLSPALFFILVSMLFISVMNVIVKNVFSEQYFWQLYMLLTFSIGLGQVLFFVLPSVRKGFLSDTRAKGLPVLLLLFTEGALSCVARALSSFGILLGPLTMNSVFISFQSLFVLVFATLISVWFPSLFKEDLSAKSILLKVLAIIVMALGLYLLYL
jgi:uncharacterized membrane protein